MSKESNSVMLERMLNLLFYSKISKIDSWQVHQKILTDIKSGVISISIEPQNCDHYINHTVKEQALKKIFYSDNFYVYERDQKILLGQPLPQQPEKRSRKQSLKEQDLLKRKKNQQQLKKDFIQKMKKWEQEKIKLAKKKREAELKKQMMHNSSEEKRKKDEKDIEAFLKLEKKKVIQARIEQIQNRKHEREEWLQESSIKRVKSQSMNYILRVPKYIQYEKQFQSLELKKNIEQEILMKNRKASLQMDMQKIKQHEKAYIQRIKQRLNLKSLSKNKSQRSLSKQQQFNVNKKDEKEMKKIQEKIKRIKKFQNKLRLVPLKVDSQKKRQRQILQDKLKNPKKYHFLSQKALSDEQIFDNFKEFDINIDFKDIGNNYLEEVIQKNKGLKRKVVSQKVFPVNKPQYKNYLQQLRANKNNVQIPDQFDNYANKIKNNKYKDHGKNFLKEKSDIHEKKAIQSILELQKIERYKDSIRKEEEIDDNYAKALRAKIALAKLN